MTILSELAPKNWCYIPPSKWIFQIERHRKDGYTVIRNIARGDAMEDIRPSDALATLIPEENKKYEMSVARTNLLDHERHVLKLIKNGETTFKKLTEGLHENVEIYWRKRLSKYLIIFQKADNI